MNKDATLEGILCSLLLLATPLQAQESLLTEYFPITQTPNLAETNPTLGEDQFSEVVIFSTREKISLRVFSLGTLTARRIFSSERVSDAPLNGVGKR